jgi:hypothetical protein
MSEKELRKLCLDFHYSQYWLEVTNPNRDEARFRQLEAILNALKASNPTTEQTIILQNLKVIST